MSKRLASFAGPSAPSSSPIPAQSTEPANNKSDSGPKKKNKGRDVTPSSPSPFSPSREPKSPSAQRRPKLEAFSPSRNSRVSAHAPSTLKSKSLAFLESPIQISTRIALKRTAADLEEWKTVVSRYAFKCARALVDGTTELENALGVLPDASQPRSRMLGPRLRDLNSKREELRGYMVELDICFIRIAERVASLERGLVKLIQHDGIESTEGDPVWKSTSWPFIHHVSHVAQLLRFLNRANHSLNTFAALIISYSFSSTRSLENYNGVVTTFETSQSLSTSHTDRSSPTFPQARTALASWSGEASRSTEFVQEWCGICAVEVPAWEEIEVGREESEEEDALKDI